MNGPSFFFHAGTPDHQAAEGWTGFTWVNGWYQHEHRAIVHTGGWGSCWADYYFSGSIVGHGYVTYATWQD